MEVGLEGMKPFLSLPLDTTIAFNAAHRSYTFHGAKPADHTFGRKDLGLAHVMAYLSDGSSSGLGGDGDDLVWIIQRTNLTLQGEQLCSPSRFPNESPMTDS